MSHPLDDCRAKLARATEHIKRINDDIIVHRKFYVPSDCVRANLQVEASNPRDPATYQRRVVFFLKGNPGALDSSYTILAGECLHQLRSVLDHLVYHLVIDHTKSAPAFNSAFPIVGRGRQVKKAWRSAADEYANQVNQLKRSISSAAEAEIHRLQPYQRGADFGKDPLWLLSELDNAYKHRHLLLTNHRVTAFWTRLQSGGKELKAAFQPDIAFEHDAEVGRVTITDPDFSIADSDLMVENDIVISIAFADGLGASSHKSVLDCLGGIRRHVQGIVDTFAALM